MNKAEWSAPQWQGFVATRKTKEERKKALEEVPEEWRKRVENHVRTVFSIRKFHARVKTEKTKARR